MIRGWKTKTCYCTLTNLDIFAYLSKIVVVTIPWETIGGPVRKADTLYIADERIDMIASTIDSRDYRYLTTTRRYPRSAARHGGSLRPRPRERWRTLSKLNSILLNSEHSRCIIKLAIRLQERQRPQWRRNRGDEGHGKEAPTPTTNPVGLSIRTVLSNTRSNSDRQRKR